MTKDKKRKKGIVAYIKQGWHKDFYIEKHGQTISYMHSVLFINKHEGMVKVRITFEEV
jgi:hypothetical protein